jgi:hypothetical protein
MGKLHTEELHIRYVLPGTIREINVRKMKLLGNVARVCGMRKENICF